MRVDEPFTSPFTIGIVGLNLSDADMGYASLRRARLPLADLRRAALRRAWLIGADLRGADLRGADLRGAHLTNANLMGARFSRETLLSGATLGGAILVDVDWGGVSFSGLDWDHYLDGDTGTDRWCQAEIESHQTAYHGIWSAYIEAIALDWMLRKQQDLPSLPKDQPEASELARRTYAQLSPEFSQRGMTDLSEKSSYLAKQQASRTLRPWSRRLGHRALGYLCGWGYRPGRTVLWWVLINLLFTGIYVFEVHAYVHHPIEALALSITSFHGRGLAVEPSSNGTTIVVLSAIEAVVGLVIEAAFVATFVRRFLN
jgi:hypothetical protein